MEKFLWFFKSESPLESDASPSVKDLSLLFEEVAHKLYKYLPDGAEKMVALRKLLESRDAAMRARLAKAVVNE